MEEEVRAGDSLERLEGFAPEIQALRARIRHLAAFDAVGGPGVPTLLLQGETGTGKGLVARIVHDSGPRARGPFVPVNCAAIPDTMLEAEIFGHEPGAFTDARRARPGLFEAADQGTLFLDEIDSLSLGLQAKLLTAIESKRVRRLGAVAERAVDVKLLAATQHDLAELVQSGRFRPDLYHRLAVVVLGLPPLRERGDDVIVLARVLLERLARGYGARPKRLTADGEEWLRRHPWPGNVRELAHLMERVTLLHAAATVDSRALDGLATGRDAALAPAARAASPPPHPPAHGDHPEAAEPAGPDRAVAPADAGETQELRRALARTGGNVVRAARLLGVSRDTIRYRMRRLGITRGDLDVAPDTPAPADPDAGVEDRQAERAPAPGWEQKPAAVVAVSLTWPEGDDGAWSHEPWTEHQRWARRIRDKLRGLGGLPLQESPALSLWAFGLPRTVDQLLERAIHGALAVRQIASGSAAPEHAPELRVAVHHGALLVDATASDPARTVLAVGDTLALPVRLLGDAAAGELVASHEVGQRVEAWARAERREPHAAAGPPAWRIDGLRPWRERGASGRLTPFVGRERELATLTELLAAAEAGAGQLVGLVGAPGAGKSRLLRELRRRLDGRGIVYNEAHALAHGATTPLLPFVEMARSHFDVTEADSPETVREHVDAGLGEIGLDPAADAPYLIALLGGARPASVDAETLTRRMVDLIRRIAVALSERAPLVLAIENAHWLDPTSEACVAELAAHLGGTRCLLVMTYRPGYEPGWLDRSYATQIAVAPLTAPESRRMIGAIAGTRDVPHPLTEQVLAWAEGNPLFLEELMRSVLEEGSPPDATIPQTVHAVLAARIDRLGPAERWLLQVAAVIGHEVPHDALERAAGLGDEALRDGLARLGAAELLLERSSRAVRTYGFRHALTQAAAYRSVPAAVRSTLHRRVLEALLSLGGESRPEMLPRLAEHAAAAGEERRALAYHRQAGLHLLAGEANQEAARCFEDALAALGRLDPGDGVEDLRLGCDLRLEAIQALYRVGQLTRAAQLGQDAFLLAERLADPTRLAPVLTATAQILSNEGRHAEAMTTATRALALADAHDITIMRIWTGIIIGRTCLALGRFREGIARLATVVDAMGEEGDRRPAFPGVVPSSPSARTFLALCLARTGELDEAVTHAEAALDAAERSGSPTDRAWASYALGRVHHARSDWDRAIPLLERAVNLCESVAFAPYLPRILSGLASAYAQSGRNAEAVPLLERALAAGRAIRLAYGETLIMCQLGTTSVELGRVDEAERLARQALTLARERGERGEEAWALLLLGDVAARREPPMAEEARAWYAQAITLGEELGMRPHVARTRLALGALEQRAGRFEDARRHLATAAAAARAMGIRAWETRAADLAR